MKRQRKPRPRTTWTVEQEARLRALAPQGYSNRQLAHIFGVSEGAIRGACARYEVTLQGRKSGLPPLPPGVPPMPEPVVGLCVRCPYREKAKAA